jgi:hypothetical protein
MPPPLFELPPPEVSELEHPAIAAVASALRQIAKTTRSAWRRMNPSLSLRSLHPPAGGLKTPRALACSPSKRIQRTATSGKME